MKNNKEYWFCVIGPIEREKQPWGADGPMRMAVKDAFFDLFDENDEHCYSGWGVDQKTANKILKVTNGE